MTDARLFCMLHDMVVNSPSPTGLRRWQDVAREQQLSLRVLGEKVDRRHTTMLAYSCGARIIPQDVLAAISRVLGEDVR